MKKKTALCLLIGVFLIFNFNLLFFLFQGGFGENVEVKSNLRVFDSLRSSGLEVDINDLSFDDLDTEEIFENIEIHKSYGDSNSRRSLGGGGGSSSGSGSSGGESSSVSNGPVIMEVAQNIVSEEEEEIVLDDLVNESKPVILMVKKPFVIPVSNVEVGREEHVLVITFKAENGAVEVNKLFFDNSVDFAVREGVNIKVQNVMSGEIYESFLENGRAGFDLGEGIKLEAGEDVTFLVSVFAPIDISDREIGRSIRLSLNYENTVFYGVKKLNFNRGMFVYFPTGEIKSDGFEIQKKEFFEEFPSISSYNIVYNKGWNLISLPYLDGQKKAEESFYNLHSGDEIYEWIGEDEGDGYPPTSPRDSLEGYEKVEFIDSKKGYWINFPEERRFVIPALSEPDESIRVEEGWGMIGVASPIEVSEIEKEEIVKNGEVWIDKGSWYEKLESGDLLLPGIGYYIDALESGVLFPQIIEDKPWYDFVFGDTPSVNQEESLTSFNIADFKDKDFIKAAENFHWNVLEDLKKFEDWRIEVDESDGAKLVIDSVGDSDLNGDNLVDPAFGGVVSFEKDFNSEDYIVQLKLLQDKKYKAEIVYLDEDGNRQVWDYVPANAVDISAEYKTEKNVKFVDNNLTCVHPGVGLDSPITFLEEYDYNYTGDISGMYDGDIPEEFDVALVLIGSDEKPYMKDKTPINIADIEASVIERELIVQRVDTIGELHHSEWGVMTVGSEKEGYWDENVHQQWFIDAGLISIHMTECFSDTGECIRNEVIQVDGLREPRQNEVRPTYIKEYDLVVKQQKSVSGSINTDNDLTGYSVQIFLKTDIENYIGTTKVKSDGSFIVTPTTISNGDLVVKLFDPEGVIIAQTYDVSEDGKTAKGLKNQWGFLAPRQKNVPNLDYINSLILGRAGYKSVQLVNKESGEIESWICDSSVPESTTTDIFVDNHIIEGEISIDDLEKPEDYRIEAYGRTDRDYYFGSSEINGDGAYRVESEHGGRINWPVARLVRKLDNRVVASSDNPVLGGWAFPIAYDGTHSFRLINRNTGKIADEWHKTSGLLRSYYIPEDHELNGYLTERTFIYDQAVSTIVATNLLDEETATRWVKGLLEAQSEDGQFPFSVDMRSGVDPDPYYRTGAQMWAVYALGRFVEMYPDNPIAPDVKFAIKKSLDRQIELYYYGNFGFQEGLFTGGMGWYGGQCGGGLERIDYDYFDDSCKIQWVSTEHNLDAYFALKSAYTVTEIEKYDEIAEEVADNLLNGLWNFDEGRAYQGTTVDFKDEAHALDLSSWYSLFAFSRGEEERGMKALDIVEKYQMTSVDGSGGCYAPYIDEFGYLESARAEWGEGCAGVILARTVALEQDQSQEDLALSDLFSLMKLYNDREGVLYTDKPDYRYEFQPWISSISTAWSALAACPKGVMGADVELLDIEGYCENQEGEKLTAEEWVDAATILKEEWFNVNEMLQGLNPGDHNDVQNIVELRERLGDIELAIQEIDENKAKLPTEYWESFMSAEQIEDIKKNEDIKKIMEDQFGLNIVSIAYLMNPIVSAPADAGSFFQEMKLMKYGEGSWLFASFDLVGVASLGFADDIFLDGFTVPSRVSRFSRVGKILDRVAGSIQTTTTGIGPGKFLEKDWAFSKNVKFIGGAQIGVLDLERAQEIVKGGGKIVVDEGSLITDYKLKAFDEGSTAYKELEWLRMIYSNPGLLENLRVYRNGRLIANPNLLTGFNLGASKAWGDLIAQTPKYGLVQDVRLTEFLKKTKITQGEYSKAVNTGVITREMIRKVKVAFPSISEDWWNANGVKLIKNYDLPTGADIFADVIRGAGGREEFIKQMGLRSVRVPILNRFDSINSARDIDWIIEGKYSLSFNWIHKVVRTLDLSDSRMEELLERGIEARDRVHMFLLDNFKDVDEAIVALNLIAGEERYTKSSVYSILNGEQGVKASDVRIFINDLAKASEVSDDVVADLFGKVGLVPAGAQDHIILGDKNFIWQTGGVPRARYTSEILDEINKINQMVEGSGSVFGGRGFTETVGVLGQGFEDTLRALDENDHWISITHHADEMIDVRKNSEFQSMKMTAVSSASFGPRPQPLRDALDSGGLDMINQRIENLRLSDFKFGHAKVISDPKGAMTYTLEPDVIMRKYGELQIEGDRLFFNIDLMDNTFIGRNGEVISVLDWINEFEGYRIIEGEGFTVIENGRIRFGQIALERTVDALYIPSTRLIEVKSGFPPARKFQVVLESRELVISGFVFGLDAEEVAKLPTEIFNELGDLVENGEISIDLFGRISSGLKWNEKTEYERFFELMGREMGDFDYLNVERVKRSLSFEDVANRMSSGGRIITRDEVEDILTGKSVMTPAFFEYFVQGISMKYTEAENLGLKMGRLRELPAVAGGSGWDDAFDATLTDLIAKFGVPEGKTVASQNEFVRKTGVSASTLSNARKNKFLERSTFNNIMRELKITDDFDSGVMTKTEWGRKLVFKYDDASELERVDDIILGHPKNWDGDPKLHPKRNTRDEYAKWIGYASRTAFDHIGKIDSLTGQKSELAKEMLFNIYVREGWSLDELSVRGPQLLKRDINPIEWFYILMMDEFADEVKLFDNTRSLDVGWEQARVVVIDNAITTMASATFKSEGTIRSLRNGNRGTFNSALFGDIALSLLDSQDALIWSERFKLNLPKEAVSEFSRLEGWSSLQRTKYARQSMKENYRSNAELYFWMEDIGGKAVLVRKTGYSEGRINSLLTGYEKITPTFFERVATVPEFGIVGSERIRLQKLWGLQDGTPGIFKNKDLAIGGDIDNFVGEAKRVNGVAQSDEQAMQIFQIAVKETLDKGGTVRINLGTRSLSATLNADDNVQQNVRFALELQSIFEPDNLWKLDGIVFYRNGKVIDIADEFKDSFPVILEWIALSPREAIDLSRKVGVDITKDMIWELGWSVNIRDNWARTVFGSEHGRAELYFISMNKGGVDKFANLIGEEPAKIQKIIDGAEDIDDDLFKKIADAEGYMTQAERLALARRLGYMPPISGGSLSSGGFALLDLAKSKGIGDSNFVEKLVKEGHIPEKNVNAILTGRGLPTEGFFRNYKIILGASDDEMIQVREAFKPEFDKFYESSKVAVREFVDEFAGGDVYAFKSPKLVQKALLDGKISRELFNSWTAQFGVIDNFENGETSYFKSIWGRKLLPGFEYSTNGEMFKDMYISEGHTVKTLSELNSYSESAIEKAIERNLITVELLYVTANKLNWNPQKSKGYIKRFFGEDAPGKMLFFKAVDEFGDDTKIYSGDQFIRDAAFTEAKSKFAQKYSFGEMYISQLIRGIHPISDGIFNTIVDVDRLTEAQTLVLSRDLAFVPDIYNLLDLSSQFGWKVDTDFNFWFMQYRGVSPKWNDQFAFLAHSKAGSIEQFAKDMDKTRAHISRFVSGKKPLSEPVYQKMLAKYTFTADELAVLERARVGNVVPVVGGGTTSNGGQALLDLAKSKKRITDEMFVDLMVINNHKREDVTAILIGEVLPSEKFLDDVKRELKLNNIELREIEGVFGVKPALSKLEFILFFGTQADMARRMDVQDSTITSWIYEGSRISPENVEKMASVTGVDVNVLGRIFRPDLIDFFNKLEEVSDNLLLKKEALNNFLSGLSYAEIELIPIDLYDDLIDKVSTINGVTVSIRTSQFDDLAIALGWDDATKITKAREFEVVPIAGNQYSDKILAEILKSNIRITDNAFPTHRDFSDYVVDFGGEFQRQYASLGEGHVINFGAGDGNDLIDFIEIGMSGRATGISVGLPLQATDLRNALSDLPDKIDYMERYVETIDVGELKFGKAKIIYDAGGASMYAPDMNMVFRKAWEFLEDDGYFFVTLTDKTSFVDVNGLEITRQEWERSIRGLEFVEEHSVGDSLVFRKKAGENFYVPPAELIDFKAGEFPSYSPTREYRIVMDGASGGAWNPFSGFSIKEFVEFHGTQVDMAGRLGVDQSLVSNWVTGRNKISLENINKIASEYGYSEESILRIFRGLGGLGGSGGTWNSNVGKLPNDFFISKEVAKGDVSSELLDIRLQKVAQEENKFREVDGLDLIEFDRWIEDDKRNFGAKIFWTTTVNSRIQQGYYASGDVVMSNRLTKDSKVYVFSGEEIVEVKSFSEYAIEQIPTDTVRLYRAMSLEEASLWRNGDASSLEKLRQIGIANKQPESTYYKGVVSYFSAGESYGTIARFGEVVVIVDVPKEDIIKWAGEKNLAGGRNLELNMRSYNTGNFNDRLIEVVINEEAWGELMAHGFRAVPPVGGGAPFSYEGAKKAVLEFGVDISSRLGQERVHEFADDPRVVSALVDGKVDRATFNEWMKHYGNINDFTTSGKKKYDWGVEMIEDYANSNSGEWFKDALYDINSNPTRIGDSNGFGVTNVETAIATNNIPRGLVLFTVNKLVLGRFPKLTDQISDVWERRLLGVSIEEEISPDYEFYKFVMGRFGGQIINNPNAGVRAKGYADALNRFGVRYGGMPPERVYDMAFGHSPVSQKVVDSIRESGLIPDQIMVNLPEKFKVGEGYNNLDVVLDSNTLVIGRDEYLDMLPGDFGRVDKNFVDGEDKTIFDKIMGGHIYISEGLANGKKVVVNLDGLHLDEIHRTPEGMLIGDDLLANYYVKNLLEINEFSNLNGVTYIKNGKVVEQSEMSRLIVEDMLFEIQKAKLFGKEYDFRLDDLVRETLDFDTGDWVENVLHPPLPGREIVYDSIDAQKLRSLMFDNPGQFRDVRLMVDSDEITSWEILEKVPGPGLSGDPNVFGHEDIVIANKYWIDGVKGNGQILREQPEFWMSNNRDLERIAWQGYRIRIVFDDIEENRIWTSSEFPYTNIRYALVGATKSDGREILLRDYVVGYRGGVRMTQEQLPVPPSLVSGSGVIGAPIIIPTPAIRIFKTLDGDDNGTIEPKVDLDALEKLGIDEEELEFRVSDERFVWSEEEGKFVWEKAEVGEYVVTVSVLNVEGEILDEYDIKIIIELEVAEEENSKLEVGDKTESGTIIVSDIGHVNEKEERIVDLGEGEGIVFELSSNEGSEEHSLSIIGVGEEKATIVVESEPIIFELREGESREIDVDFDGVEDIIVAVDKIDGLKVNVVMKAIFEKEEIIEDDVVIEGGVIVLDEEVIIENIEGESLDNEDNLENEGIDLILENVKTEPEKSVTLYSYEYGTSIKGVYYGEAFNVSLNVRAVGGSSGPFRVVLVSDEEAIRVESMAGTTKGKINGNPSWRVKDEIYESYTSKEETGSIKTRDGKTIKKKRKKRQLFEGVGICEVQSIEVNEVIECRFENVVRDFEKFGVIVDANGDIDESNEENNFVLKEIPDSAKVKSFVDTGKKDDEVEEEGLIDTTDEKKLLLDFNFNGEIEFQSDLIYFYRYLKGIDPIVPENFVDFSISDEIINRIEKAVLNEELDIDFDGNVDDLDAMFIYRYQRNFGINAQFGIATDQMRMDNPGLPDEDILRERIERISNL